MFRVKCMKKYISLVALVLFFGNLFGSESEKKEVRFLNHLVVYRYNGAMPITQDTYLRRVSSQNFDLYHTTVYTKDELVQNVSFRKKFLAFMGCLPRLKP